MALLELVCAARFGGQLQTHKAALRKELGVYWKSWRGTAPSRQTLLYWFTKNSEPSSDDSKKFLSSYLQDFASRAALLPEQQEKIQEIQALLNSPNTHPPSTSAPAPPHALRREQQDDSVVRAMFSMLLQKGTGTDRREDEDFFYCSPFDQPDAHDDESYYIAYRYSTTDKQILKIFVVLKRPTSKSRQYSFLIFVRGGETEPHATRESQGIILRYEHSYYFLGYNYHVAGERSLDQEEQSRRRTYAKTQPNSLITVAVEKSDIALDRGLFPALTMSTAAQNQPVIARVAALHLGTRTSLGRRVSHADIDPTQLPPENLPQDLYDIVSRLCQASTPTFGVTLNEIVKKGELGRSSFESLSDSILGMIDNLPAIESGDEPQLNTARGAIETFAKRRQLRPRP